MHRGFLHVKPGSILLVAGREASVVKIDVFPDITYKPPRQMLGNTAWAFATVIELDEKLFTALARVAKWRMCASKPQELANAA